MNTPKIADKKDFMNETLQTEGATLATRQAQFLVDHGNSLLRWSRETVVIESYFEKQFKAIGGQMNLLLACFEDNGNMDDATEEYLRLSQSEGANTAST